MSDEPAGRKGPRKTDQNRPAKPDKRGDRLRARTRSMIGQDVRVSRSKKQGGPAVGQVIAVIQKGDDRYPHDAVRRRGSYLLVETRDRGRCKVARNRVKVLR